MSITKDWRDGDTNFIIREHYDSDGSQFAQTTLAPSVLPMTGFSFDELEVAVWLIAVKTSKGIHKGDIFRLKHIHHDGSVVLAQPEYPYRTDWWWGQASDSQIASDRLSTVPGLWKMELFALFVPNQVQLDMKGFRIPMTAKPLDETPKKPATK